MDFVVPQEGDEQFDAAVLAKGFDSRYAHQADPMAWPGPLIWSIAHGVVLVRDIFLREVRSPKTIPDIVGRTNTSYTFGALAFNHDGRYFVSVNFGSVVLIQDLVHRIFSMPEAFPWLGDISKEDPNRLFHPVMTNAAAYMQTIRRDLRLAKPMDAVREQCAAMFNLIANEFVVAHEMWHAVGGHLAWGASNSSTSLLQERVESFEMSSIAEDKRRRLVQQALEMDADSFAVFQVLRRLIALIDADGSNRVAETPAQAVEAAIACGAVMVGAFFAPEPDPQRWTFRSHPPGLVRHKLMILAADRALRIMKLEQVRQETTANASWVARMQERIFVRLWRSIGAENRDKELALSLGSEGDAHVSRVMDAWASVADRVRAFSPVPKYPLYP